MVLQRPGDDLRRRGRTAVDQHHHRQTVEQVAGLGVETARIVGAPAARRHDLAAFEEAAAHRHRLFEQTARVVAQVEHQPLHAVADPGAQFLQPLFDSRLRLFVERGDAQIAHIAFGPPAHGPDADDVADQADVEGRRRALAQDGDGNARLHRAAHALDRFRQGEAHDRFAVDMADEVARLQPGARRRGVVDRRYDLDQAVFHRDLDAEAAELAAGLHLHVLELARRQEARMRVQRREHPLDGGLDELFVGHVLDIFRADALEHVAEQVELAVCLRIRAGGPGGEQRRRQQPQRCAEARESASHPLTFRSSDVSQATGSTGRPRWRTSTRRRPLSPSPVIAPTGSPAATRWPTSLSIRARPAITLW